MNIAHVGATGKVGSKILTELLSRGHQVTVIARNPEKVGALANVKLATGDVADPKALANLLKGHDAIISSAPFKPGSSAPLLDAVVASGVKRYICVGGAGSLEIAPAKC